MGDIMDLESREAAWAVIEGDTVINVIVWDGETRWTPPAGTIIEPLADYPQVGIGWTYNPKATVNKFVDNRPTEEPTDGDD
jgi:hypothetical protein